MNTNYITSENYTGKELVVIVDGGVQEDGIYNYDEAMKIAADTEADGIDYAENYDENGDYLEDQ